MAFADISTAVLVPINGTNKLLSLSSTAESPPTGRYTELPKHCKGINLEDGNYNACRNTGKP